MTSPHFTHIDHLGIAVANLAEAEARYTAMFGVEPYKREEVEREGVMTSFFQVGPNKIELLEATKPDSPIAKHVEKRGEGLAPCGLFGEGHSGRNGAPQSGRFSAAE